MESEKNRFSFKNYFDVSKMSNSNKFPTSKKMLQAGPVVHRVIIGRFKNELETFLVHFEGYKNVLFPEFV